MGQISFANTGAVRMVTTKQWDFLNRLTNVVSATNGTAVSSFAYGYDSVNEKTSCTNVDSTYWIYSYDSLGQVTSGKHYWADGTPIAGQQFEYAFDNIGNRTATARGGDEQGRNLRSANYSANNLNQYTSRDVPGYKDILGSAAANVTVSIWTESGNFAQTYRHSNYFRGELALNNSTGALWLDITNVGVLRNGTNGDIVTNIIGNAYLAKNEEDIACDADGNQLRDGRWTNSWDAENRLFTIISLTNAPSSSTLRLTFGYDAQWRRIFKTVEAWNGAAWTVTLSNKFIYDGWNLIAELNGTNNILLSSYMWGSDLSGSMQEAGGVGGLLKVADCVGSATHHFAAYDGNGNVAAIIDAGTGAITAQYEYDPFAEPLRAFGTMAKRMPLRFSTKYTDNESGLIYYGYRYYNPSTGRWLTRDPVAELGGVNLYGFAGNDLIITYDPKGLLLAPAAGCAVRVAIGFASVPAGAVILDVAVTAGVVYITYKVCTTVCDQMFCANRHPTWPSCLGQPSDPVSAILTARGAGTWPGWKIDGPPSVTDSGPADPGVCISGGSTFYTVKAKFFTVLDSGTITYTVNLSVACCDCCNTFLGGTYCRIIHPSRGSGGQPPPPSGPPYQGPRL